MKKVFDKVITVNDNIDIIVRHKRVRNTYDEREKPWEIDPFAEFKGVCTNVENYKEWLLENREWDYSYLDQILKLKLEHILDHQVNHAISYVGQDKVIKVLKICLHLLDRLLKDEYLYKEHKKCRQDRNKYVKRDKESGFIVTKVLDQEAYEREVKKSIKLIEKEAALRDYDRELLYKYLNRYHTRLWD